MAFIKTIAPAQAQDEVRIMYERQQSAWGYVPNYAKVFCHRPEVMARWGRLLAEIRRPMEARRFELITFAAALELRNSACALAHGKALTAFLSAEEIQTIAHHKACAALNDAENAMMKFARKVARDASEITLRDIEVLRSHNFLEAEIFDIAATVAGRAFFTKILDSLGVEPDSGFLGLDGTLKETLTVGRQIDRSEPEVMAASE